jgi:hypothetical protein
MTKSIQWNDIKDYSKWPYENQSILIKYKGFVWQGRYSNSLVHILPIRHGWVYLADCDGWVAVKEQEA